MMLYIIHFYHVKKKFKNVGGCQKHITALPPVLGIYSLPFSYPPPPIGRIWTLSDTGKRGQVYY